MVTWDFTPVSEAALKHASLIAQKYLQKIELVHIVEKGLPTQKLKNKEEEMANIARDASAKHGVKVFPKVLKGSIFTTISEYANDEVFSMVVMGTHGMRGMQKVTGSWALKVIIGSKVPFLVVRKDPEAGNPFDNIVSPVDFKSENKEKLFWAINIAKSFRSKVYLFERSLNDKSLQKRINVNTIFARKHLIRNGIEHELVKSTPGENFAMESVEFARSKKSGLLIVTTTKHISLTDYIFGAREQSVIANDIGVPVMCINPMASFSKVGQFMYGG
jgi:nucleotide-binding universal stress UspA family protein